MYIDDSESDEEVEKKKKTKKKMKMKKHVDQGRATKASKSEHTTSQFVYGVPKHNIFHN